MCRRDGDVSMGLEVFIEDEFEHSHEAKQAAELYTLLSQQIPRDAHYTLIYNFYLNGKQIDALLITPHRFIIIDFKKVCAPLKTLDANGHWMCVDGYELQGSGYGNPFKQVTQYRRHLGKILLDAKREIFARLPKTAPGHSTFGEITGLIMGAVYLSPELNAHEPDVKDTNFPKWFYFGRPATFVERTLMIQRGAPLILSKEIHQAFICHFSGLRRAIFGENGIPKRPLPIIPSTNNLMPVSCNTEFSSEVLPTEDETHLTLLSKVTAAIDNNVNCLIISGSAGTGKTTLIKELIPLLLERRYNVALMAPTGRAAKVMQQRTNHPAATIHSSIYKIPEEPEMDDDGNAVRFIFPLKQSCPPDAAIIVDESSMVALSQHNDELLKFGTGSILKDLITYAGVDQKENRNVLIFVGDHCQLNPVGEKCKTPPALDPEILKELLGYSPLRFELTKIHRQQEGSGILEEAARIRSGIINKRFDCFRYRAHPDVIIMESDKIFDAYKQIENINEKMIIAQTNTRVWEYNQQAREILNFGDKILVEGERLINLQNTIVPIAEDNDQYEERIMNGEFIQIDALPKKEPCRISGFYRPKNSDQAIKYTFTFRKMTFSWPYERERGQVTAWVNITPIVSPEWRENHEYASIALYNGIKAKIRERLIAQGKRATEKDIRDCLKKSVLLHAPIVSYGYAITGHKSQGGEWDNVWVDYHYAQNQKTDDYFRWAYTVTTRAKKTLYAITPPAFDVLLDCFNSFDDNKTSEMSIVPQKEPKKITQLLTEYGYTIQKIVERPYAYRVSFAKQMAEPDTVVPQQYIDVTFNGKNCITSITTDHASTLEESCKQDILAMKGLPVKSVFDEFSQNQAPTPKRSHFEVHKNHRVVADRIRQSVEKTQYTLVSIGSLNEFQLRTTLEYTQLSGFFDVYFKDNGLVSKMGQYTLPYRVMLEIKENI